MKHTILFLAANPLGTDPRALDREARAIQVELERSGLRDRFELVTRWGAEPLDLLRELRKLKPTVVHFSGHGVPKAAGQNGAEPRHGLFFQGSDGHQQLVSTEALEETFGSAGGSVKLVVLSACYSEVQASALLLHVDCVVGMSGAIHDDTARGFAIGFYGGLGERESIATAYKQGCAAISLEGLRDRPQLAVRAGVDASKLVLAVDSVEPRASQAGTGASATSQPSQPEARNVIPSWVDIGIVTVRDDELRAVLGAFPSEAGTGQGSAAAFTSALLRTRPTEVSASAGVTAHPS